MSTRQKTALFILVPTIVMFLCAPCKSSALSTRPAQVVKEFVKASKEADFKKIAELSCKDSGLYPTLEDAQKLDLSEFGFIEEVIREEICEVDPEGWKIVVARLNFLGKMDFRHFLVFKTEKGWKVHISEGILGKYPIGELSILKTATYFYISNKIKLDIALRSAQKIVDLETNGARNHLILGYVYQLKESLEDDKDLKQSFTEKKFSEYTQTIKIDKHYAEKSLDKQELIIVWKRLLEDTDKELKYYAADKLYELGEKQSVPILIEKWQNIFEESESKSTWESAANQLAKIGGKDSVPFLCKALEEKKAVYVIAHLLGKLGDNRAVPSLIKALDTNDFNTATKVIEALGKIGDKRAEPALKTILEKELVKKWISSEQAEAILYSLDKVTGEKWSNSFMEEKGKIFYPNSILNKINGMFSDIHMWGTKKVDCDILGERLNPSNPNYNRLRQWICERWIKRCPSFNCQKALIKNLNELEIVFRIETRDKREYLDTASLTLKKSGNKWNIVDVKEGLPTEEASLEKATHDSENRKTHSKELEKKSTSSLLNVTQEKQTAIYFVTGHGERQFEDYDRGGISGIANALKRDNCRIAPLDILNTKKIPDDCNVLVVAGPTKAYLTEELNIIRNYLENRGKLLLMLEPAVTPNNPTGFKTLMAEYGIVVRDDIVVYNKMNLPLFGIQSVAEIYVGKDEYAEFKITDGLKCTIILRACSVGSAPPNDQMPYQATVLINAPKGSWGETDNANLRQRKPELNVDVDLQGPVSLAVASQVKELPKSVTQSHPAMANDPNAQPQGARLVVFGDVDFASNEYIENPGNADLFRNSVNWLAKKETQLGISAKEETLEQEQEETNAIEEAKKQQIPSLQEEGSNALKNQNCNAAVQAYKKLLEIDPENYDANTNIGTAYTMLNEFDLSIKHLAKAQQLKPAEYQPYYLMGIAYAKKGDKDHAIDSLRDAFYKGYKDLSVSDLEKDTNFPEDFKQDQRFKGLLGKLTINKLISDVKDAGLFSTHSQVFPYRYDEVWDAVNYDLKKQKENITLLDKETGIIVSDSLSHWWHINGKVCDRVDKYYIVIEKINETTSQLKIKLIIYYYFKDQSKTNDISLANGRVEGLLNRVEKQLKKNK